ncbi:MAG TPA: 50S ribosomal protein L24 [Microbacteriaceae bacterium]|nr:50S ribosomal protein L24 [Microbacteriaceae bacterium]
MSKKIKTGDLVQVISGRKQVRGGDRGKQGRVLSIIGERVVVEGVNLATKHVKVGQTQRGTQTGGIEHVEAPIHISNVALVNPETKAPARVGSQIVNGEKQRVYKASRYAAKPEKPAAKKKSSKPADEAAEPATEEN